MLDCALHTGLRFSKSMLKTLRIVAGVLTLALILAASSRAVRDCPIGPFTYENCIWLEVRDALHLPQSKFLRGLTLELIGVCLLAGVLLTVRYIFPTRKAGGDEAKGGFAEKSEVAADPSPSPRR